MGKDQDLIEASKKGEVDVIEKILGQKHKKGILPGTFRSANLHYQDSAGYTALHHTALNGHRNAVESLLQRHASANVIDNQGCYPLHLAAWGGHSKVCKSLLTHGPSIAEVNQQNNNGETAVLIAAHHGHTETVTVLLENHGDPTILNTKNESTLDLACQFGRLDTVRVLINWSPVLLTTVTNKAASPLHLAARNGHTVVVQCLLDSGFNINRKTPSGSALHEAALFGKTEVVQEFIQRGINYSIEDKQGRTVLALLKDHSNQSVNSQEILHLIKDYFTKPKSTTNNTIRTTSPSENEYFDMQELDPLCGSQNNESNPQGIRESTYDIPSPMVPEKKKQSRIISEIIPDFEKSYTSPQAPSMPVAPPRKKPDGSSPRNSKIIQKLQNPSPVGGEVQDKEDDRKPTLYEAAWPVKQNTSTDTAGNLHDSSIGQTVSTTTSASDHSAGSEDFDDKQNEESLYETSWSTKEGGIKAVTIEKEELPQSPTRPTPAKRTSVQIRTSSHLKSEQTLSPLEDTPGEKQSTDGSQSTSDLDKPRPSSLSENGESKRPVPKVGHVKSVGVCLSPKTPDFPPPSPLTAELAIFHQLTPPTRRKRSEGGGSSSSVHDVVMETEETPPGNGPDELTEETSPDNGLDEPVVEMRNKDKEDVCDLPVFEGLRKGSSQDNKKGEIVSQIYENIQAIRSSKRPSESSARVSMGTKSDSAGSIDEDLDESEEWAQVNDIFASFGTSIARESVFVRDFEKEFEKLLRGPHQVKSVGDWLEGLGLEQYDNSFVANGFDDIDFLGGNVLEDQDLVTIGISSQTHREKILDATKMLSVIEPMGDDNQPPSVEDWLAFIRLSEYCDTFKKNGFNSIEDVRKVWVVQLTTVLGVSSLGHRKRILASLGERPDERGVKDSKTEWNLSPLSETFPPPASVLDVDMYTDYRGVKSNVKEDDQTEEQQAHHLKQYKSNKEKKIVKEGAEISRGFSIRPPHLAQEKSTVKQWRHNPETLIKGCCNYTSQYLGSMLVEKLNGVDSTRQAIAKMKNSTNSIAKTPTIQLSISYKGVKFIDAESKNVICEHEVGNIFCACQDTSCLNFFAYITKDLQTGKHYCHVFSVNSVDLAREVILTLGEAFEVAFQMTMKDRELKAAHKFETKLGGSTSDLGSDSYTSPDDTST